MLLSLIEILHALATIFSMLSAAYLLYVGNVKYMSLNISVVQSDPVTRDATRTLTENPEV